MKFLTGPGHIKIGSTGEKIAEKFLIKKGYSILERNFQNNFGKRMGEIDIIAKKGNCLCFVEVKTRTSQNSLPEENITFSKLQKISRISQFYIRKNSLWGLDVKYDAISININKATNTYNLRHIENIYL